MATITFKRKGIIYTGTETSSGSNLYTFTYKNNNYIRYKTLNANGDSVSTINYYSTSTGAVKIDTLSPNVDYYLAKYHNGANKPYGISLSHNPNDAILGWISATDFYNGFNMPGAKVRFHPNGGTGTDSYGLTSEGYSVATNTVSEGTMNLWNVNSIFKRDGYTGATDASAWRLDHPSSGTLINQASVDLHTNYPVYFPNTTITLYA